MNGNPDNSFLYASNEDYKYPLHYQENSAPDKQQVRRLALNAITVFLALHPEANPHDYRIVLLLDRAGALMADVVPTDKYAREALN